MPDQVIAVPTWHTTADGGGYWQSTADVGYLQSTAAPAPAPRRVRFTTDSGFTIPAVASEGRSLALNAAQAPGSVRLLNGWSIDGNHLVVAEPGRFDIEAGFGFQASANSGVIGGMLYVHKGGTWILVRTATVHTLERDGIGDRSGGFPLMKACVDLAAGDRVAVNSFNASGFQTTGSGLFCHIDEVL